MQNDMLSYRMLQMHVELMLCRAHLASPLVEWQYWRKHPQIDNLLLDISQTVS